jgi:glucose/mannose transport system substrate-binding protein
VPREILELEVSTWWSPGSEQAAFEEVRQLHEDTHPGVVIESTVFPDSENARDFVARHVLAGAAPDTFQANIGADLVAWTMVDTANPAEVPSSRRIEPLDDLFEDNSFWEQLPEELLPALRVGELEPPFAIPINIHRLNVVYYLRATRDAYELEHGVGSFLSSARLCPRSGETSLIPPKLAIGGQDNFALILLLFENVIPAVAGADFYEAFLRGERATDPSGRDALAVFEAALRCLQRLAQGMDQESFGADRWKEALNRVWAGNADYTVMGDWVNGYLLEEGWEAEISSMPFPGTEDVFVFTSDTFPLPVDARHPEAARDLLRTFASHDAQKAFSEIKGSIPARRDVAIEGPLASLAESTRIAFANAHKVMATSGYFPPYLQVEPLVIELRKVMAQGAGDTEIAGAMKRLRDYESLLSAFQARIELGPSPPP